MTPEELWRRVLFYWRRGRMTDELEEEMSLHIALRAKQLREQGTDSSDAVYAARKQFGNKSLLKEVSRDMWGWISVERFLQDVRFALRSLRKNALFSTMAILTFALGIGANTAIFSVVNAVLLRPLPYPQPEAIVKMNVAWKDGGSFDSFTVPEFEFYRDHSDAFQALAGYRGGGTIALKRGDTPQWIQSLRATDGFFRVMGVRPAMGRDIERADTRPGSPQVAILSDSLWRSTFAGDPAIIGQRIELDDALYIVVGIMPPHFTFVEQPADVYVPLQLGHGIEDRGMNTRVIARLKPETAIAQGRANINVVFADFRKQGLAQPGQRGLQVKSYQKALAGDFGASILMLFGAVGLLLLIACANVASLLMARASSRQREISIRLAIGSGRGRLLQQFLIESLLIAFAGGVAGLLAAGWALKGLTTSIPWDIPLANHISLDARVLAFTLLLTAGTSVIFGLTSYWQASRLDVNNSLKESSAGGGRSMSRNRARGVLVVSEIAVSVMLLVGAGLLIESLYLLHQQKLGFDPAHVYTMTTPFGPTAKLNAQQIWNFEQGILRSVQATPGITSVAAANRLPLTGPNNLPTQQEGHPEHSIGGMEYRSISSQYFQTLGISVIRGRAFHESDATSSMPVAIISESVARAWWNGQNPIGDRIVVGSFQGRPYPEVLEQPRQVVGVVADVKNLFMDEAASPAIYVPASQFPRVPGSIAWAVQGNGNSSPGAILQKALLAARPNQRILNIRPMSEIVARSIARPSFNASLMSAFAGLALALTSVGIYGLLSFQVAQRTQEIGIRMALGAKRSHVLLMIVKQGALLAAVGIAIGAVGAVFLARLVSSLLAGIQASNPLVYVLVSVLLLLVALLASYIPARKASNVDPLVALRHE